MMEMAVAVRAGGAKLVMYCMIDTWHDMVWYGMAWYGMVWYGMVWCGGGYVGLQEAFHHLAASQQPPPRLTS